MVCCVFVLNINKNPGAGRWQVPCATCGEGLKGSRRDGQGGSDECVGTPKRSWQSPQSSQVLKGRDEAAPQDIAVGEGREAGNSVAGIKVGEEENAGCDGPSGQKETESGASGGTEDAIYVGATTQPDRSALNHMMLKYASTPNLFASLNDFKSDSRRESFVRPDTLYSTVNTPSVSQNWNKNEPSIRPSSLHRSASMNHCSAGKESSSARQSAAYIQPLNQNSSRGKRRHSVSGNEIVVVSNSMPLADKRASSDNSAAVASVTASWLEVAFFLAHMHARSFCKSWVFLKS